MRGEEEEGDFLMKAEAVGGRRTYGKFAPLQPVASKME
jgi:hypothetical protein